MLSCVWFPGLGLERYVEVCMTSKWWSWDLDSGSLVSQLTLFSARLAAGEVEMRELASELSGQL